MANKLIRGAGGDSGGKGGGQQHKPTESPDSLRSTQYAIVLDLISEGEIQGLVNELQSIYLNETPLQNADGTYNFTGVSVGYVYGTQSQGYIPGFGDVEHEVPVATEVKTTTPITKTVTNTNVNHVRITISTPSLTHLNVENGDLNGSKVTYAIDLQSNGGGFVQYIADTMDGKTTTRYQRVYGLSLVGSPPWDVRVRRITEDSTTSDIQNKIYWDTYTEVTEAKFRYPNSAMVGMWIDAAQFQTIPRRAFHVKGVRVQVPSNYDPVARTYAGVWDGTFKIAWSNNPAWCFYDLVINARYGLGNYIDASQVDKWALYTIGKYCDESVPTGYDGSAVNTSLLGFAWNRPSFYATEPRFTCNLYLQSREEAFNVVAAMASVFRGLAYWSSGAVTASQDAPADAKYLYSPANVVDGMFTYSGTSRKARHTVALVQWNDPADFYKQKIEYVEDRDGIARYGVVQTEVMAVGCTSQGQAHRFGLWLLFSERLETETVSFKTGLDTLYVRPGDIIKIADPTRAGKRFGGRIIAATTTSVTIDAPVTIEAGKTYTLTVVFPDGTIEEKAVTNGAGSTSVLTTSAFTQTPQLMGMWVLAANDLVPQLFRVLSVTEVEGHQFEVAALVHNPGKYAAVEDGVKLQPLPISSINVATQPSVGNVYLAENLYKQAGSVKTDLVIAWDAAPNAVRYRAEWKRDNGNWNTLPDGVGLTVHVPDVVPGSYTARVTAINGLGINSPVIQSRTTYVYGKTARPANVAGFVVARNLKQLNFAWQHVADVDLDHYELRRGTTWESSIYLGETISNNYSIATHLGGQYLIKAIDSSGNESLNAAAITIPADSNINVVVTANDATTWTGTKTDTAVDAGAITLAGAFTWSQLTSAWSAYTGTWRQSGGSVSSGNYITNVVDTGAVMTARVEINPALEQQSVSETWSKLDQPWYTYANRTWQGPAGVVSATYEMRTSNDNVTWGAWASFVTGSYRARYYQFRITIKTLDQNYLPRVTGFPVTIDVPDRIVHFEDLATSSAGTTVTFSPAFVNLQTIQATLQAGAIGDSFRVTAKSNSSATITVYDSAGVAKAGLIDVDCFGYGEI